MCLDCMLPRLYIKRAPKTPEQIEADEKKMEAIRAYIAEEKKKPEYIASEKAWKKVVKRTKGDW